MSARRSRPRPLAESRPDELRRSVARTFHHRCPLSGLFGGHGHAAGADPLQAGLEDALPLARGHVVPGAADDVPREAGRLCDPVRLVKEHRLRDHEAADPVLLQRVRRLTVPVALDALAHGWEIGRAVPLAERLPGELRAHDLVPREEAETPDGVMRALEPEEERFAGLQGAERIAAGRLPEVHLLKRLTLAEEGEPVVVGVSDEAAHPAIVLRRAIGRSMERH